MYNRNISSVLLIGLGLLAMLIAPIASSAISSSSVNKYLSLQELTDYVKSSKTISKSKKYNFPFDTLRFNKIIAYSYDGSAEETTSVIDRNNKFIPSISKQKVLSQSQADNILAKLTKKSTYGEATAACFIPHFSLVLFNDDRVVAVIDVCLDCNYLNSSIDIPAQTSVKVNKGTPEEYALIGFTKSGRKTIIDLCKELHFPYGKLKK